eukprot:TRINITY_DN664_c0_g1_i2.p1 TRINITY_DN664_c0_g1~~TRINITY_DN664_c0_g1_i2.p1  ORF type:complete len:1181 (-),score=249.42 TRINITY_DN664_c0_g1_i2:124-3630(-)
MGNNKLIVCKLMSSTKQSGVGRANSSLIRAFVLAQQSLELNNHGQGLVDLSHRSKMRKEKIAERKKGKTKKKKGKTFAENLSKAEQFRTMDYHKVELDALLSRLETSKEKGLTQSKASDLNRTLGDNVLSEKKGVPWYIKLFHELTGMFSLMLWAGGCLCFVAFGLAPEDPSNLYLGIVLFVVVILTGLVTFFQNAKSEAIMESFKNFIPPKTRVLRDAEWKSIEATKLVPGDIVSVKMGDKIPGDIRIIHSKEMKVDNSSLTGESDPLLRTVECTHPENPLETANLAFFGTLCKEGEGIGVVIQIGDSTIIGQIANLAATASTGESPLRRELDRFIGYITYIALFLGILFFGLGFLVGYTAVTNFIFAIGICVANVPEALLATVTIALTITAKKLAARKVLVRNLEAVETLGSTTCICSDKTGTLTQNIMTVQHMWYDDKLIRAENKQIKGPNFNYEYDSNAIGFRYLHECAIICSEAFFNNSPPESKYEVLSKISDPIQREKEKMRIDEEYAAHIKSIEWGRRPTVGDASETALIKFYQPIEDILSTRKKFPIKINDDHSESKIPFNSTNKFAIYIVEYPTDNSEYCLFIKGAPERIWKMCNKIYSQGRINEINDHWRKQYDAVNLKLAKGGERVLGFAKLHLPRQDFPKGFNFNCLNVETLNTPRDGYAFLGLISLIDPPRENVPFSVLKCKAAGIKVIMVTGDQPITAAAIAKQVNIISDKTAHEIAEEEGIPMEIAMKKANAIVIHGDMLAEAMLEDEGLPEAEKGRKLAQWLQKPQIVFARTSPAQKLIIVSGCQKQGHVVAVTGDGVNDSPAIKKADIGIAMGITGSEVAKDAADMVLLTDDFSAIIIGVEEGRKIFDNLKRVITYVLTSNIPEIVPFLLFVIIQFPLPLSSILILTIDLGTDILPSISLSYEEGEMDIMTRNPRTKWEHMVTGRLLVFAYGQNGVIETMSGFLTYFVIMSDFGWDFWGLFFIVTKTGTPPGSSDTYDATLPNFGNTNAYCVGNEIKVREGEIRAPDWLYLNDEKADLRMFYLKCENNIMKQTVTTKNCVVPQISGVTNMPICFTTDSLKYAQSGFLYATIWAQVSNAILVKTRFSSVKYQGIRNFMMIFAIHFEICLMLLLAYCYPLNLVLGTRDSLWYHLGILGFPLHAIQSMMKYEST